MAERRHPTQPGGMDRDDRPEPRDRRSPPFGPWARAPPAARCARARVAPRRHWGGGRGRTREGRSTPTDLHLLPPGVATGAPSGLDPPAPRRPERGRGGPLVPGERAGDGETARPSEV